MPKVSVIIPAYNAERYICEAIESVFAQTYQDLEIIIVDDGSKDDIKQILSQYGNKIRYIYQNNSGVSAARNRGIREARGEYIAFLDADDIWLSNKLMWQVSIAEENPEIALISTDAEFFNENGLLSPSQKPSDSTQFENGSLRYNAAMANINDGTILKGDFYKDLLLGNLIGLSTVLVRKECLSNVGFFNEALSICEDYELWIRIAREHSLLYLNRVTLRYRIRDDSASGELNLRYLLYQSLEVKILQNEFRDGPKKFKNLIKKMILERYKGAIQGYNKLGEYKKARAVRLGSLQLFLPYWVGEIIKK